MTTSVDRDGVARSWIADLDGADVSVVINPATEQPIAAYRNATDLDVDQAVERAAAAAPAWGRTPPVERAEILLKIADAIEAEAEEFALLESENVGKPVTHAREEMPWVWDVVRFS